MIRFVSQVWQDIVDIMLGITSFSCNLMHLFLVSFHRPVSCTTTPTQASTTITTQKADGISFIRESRYLLHRVVKSFAKKIIKWKRKAKRSRKGLKKHHIRMIRYVTTRYYLVMLWLVAYS